ncbi:DUF2535 family protein [Peribacillus tepidiphilus]|uniref:DUF2535 family protein n=1 Tax=Peribacillus tepidiphilus TaxID=2652445 RepID=UPI0012929E7B|nr:DUF2535 family protein [Peribacillus tepidiphilus]
MLFKSLEFKNVVGQKVKIIEIPLVEEDNLNYFIISKKLEGFIKTVYLSTDKKRMYSFKDYLKRGLKWPVYQRLFEETELKNNA